MVFSRSSYDRVVMTCANIVRHESKSVESVAYTHRRIKLPRRIQVVIICGQPSTGQISIKSPKWAKTKQSIVRLFKLPRLLRRQHPKRRAHLHPHRAYLAHHVKDTLKPTLPSRKVAPRRAHAEARAPVFFSLSSGGEHGLELDELLCFCCSLVARGLRTVFAYL